MKLWITGTGKLIYVVYFRKHILFLDVEEKIKIPTPPFIYSQGLVKSLNLRRGTDEYFYIITTRSEKMHVIRLDYVGNKITTKKLLIISNNSVECTKFIDFYAEERKVRIVIVVM
ncbi:uncharacterized protein LOC128668396 [Microplitis demolitor]|uniref:uncharacterized protein LOC128668396 n=1 Tax=Microplitis demolitor TaxID=69319 RepID=UPI0004CD8A27|nr:uncharacterized protein LOC128668396 [Microplitis demolitor]